MSNTKTVMGQASNQYVVPLDITDVFSTYLYTGNGSTQTITNGIDLDGEGGLVWFKNRPTSNTYHALYDTERGTEKYLMTNVTSAEQTYLNNGVTSFNADGFTVAGTSDWFNASGQDIASWTFRKAPKFFDVGTISFDGSGVGSYSHNLGSVPGMVILKLTNTTGDWFVWHKDLTSQNYAMFLNATAASSNQGGWATYTDTAVSFDSSVFANDTAVVYVFAHNDGDGGFGPDADQDIIKCGSYTGNNGQPHHVELGFEPQWLLVKNADLNTGGTWWSVVDIMRGMADTSIKLLKANTSDAEINENAFTPTATGFTVTNNNDFQNNSTNKYIYIAIRRGPLAPPESATEVFAVNATRGATNGTASSNAFTSGWPIDLLLHGARNDNDNFTVDRLRGNKYLSTNRTDAEGGWIAGLDDMDGLYLTNTTSATSEYCAWMWKRAPGFFDVVAYSGNGTAGRTVSHNLGVAPEMIWVKARDKVDNWVGWTQYGPTAGSDVWGGNLNNAGSFIYPRIVGTPTSTTFDVSSNGETNGSGYNYIAYLFASLPGISKVGSYTGNGTSQTIDCGFTSGARFVLIKRTDSTGNWFLWDSERGIVSGSEPFLMLDQTNPEETGSDEIDPDNSGFTVNQSYYTDNNVSGATYIFYAIT